ncbi:hypothetical protein EO95_09425 [Methanosarcina sp. 1.H.T.1A.1]|uniref:hypothetical protein n=1 Tax=Methanosarcina sp. 1.H.T.1A.1 TaxID=1483602 RepID=UPI0006213785|nr:hypothetical protein [Methanosarcina sp. 1.H.T.1A.1]KKH92888.1 hypothetical protein EO95_09425 [Methanosarcina sp. 1.H.T.1A.1]
MESLELQIKDIRSEHIGEQVKIKGRALNIGTQYPVYTRAAYQCLRCGHISYVEQDGFKLEEPYTGCEEETCGKKGPFKLILKESTIIDVQNIIILEEITAPARECILKSIKSFLMRSTVGLALEGETYYFTGKLSTIDAGKGKLEYVLYIDKVENVLKEAPVPSSEPTSMSIRNRIRTMKDCIKKVSDNSGINKASLDEVYKMVEEEGIDRKTAEELIKKMKQKGDLIATDQLHIRSTH